MLGHGSGGVSISQQHATYIADVKWTLLNFSVQEKSGKQRAQRQVNCTMVNTERKCDLKSALEPLAQVH